MKIKDDPKIKALQWYLKFLSEDLENMSELEFGKLGLEARFYFENPPKGVFSYMAARGLPSTIALLKKIGQDTKDLEALAKVQGIEKAAYHMPILRQEMFPPDYPWRENLRLVQTELRRFLEERSKAPPVNLTPCGKAIIYFGRDGGKFKVIYGPDDPGFTATIGPSELVEMARVSLIFALDEIPDEGAIKTCRECGKYFLHLSKKPKFFCNYKCTVKFTSRKRREKDPEGYRTAQREIMRKKYRKERAKKLGRPVEKIRFQRKSISKPDKRKEG